MSDRDSIGSLLSGLIIGGLAGWVVGTLFAPKEGEALRSELKEKYLEKEKMVEGAIRDFLAKEEEELTQLKERIKGMVKKLEGEIKGARGKVKDEYIAQKDKLMGELDKLEEAFEAGKKAYKGKAEAAEKEA